MLYINIKKAVLLMLASGFYCILFAQQLPQYTQFAINPYLVNPAIAGTEDFIHLQAGYRNQWTGFKDAPQTAYFSGHTTINNRAIGYNKQRLTTSSRVSLGMILTRDKTGPLEQSTGTASFAYNFALSPKGLRVSVGLNAGVKQFSFDSEGYTDNVLDQNDPTIQQVINKNLLNFSAGIWLYNEHFFAGASSFQLFNMDYTDADNTREYIPGSAFLRHYFFMTGFNANLGNEVSFVPSILVKTVSGSPISYDLNAKLVISDSYWLGGSYRQGDSFALLGGLLINDRLELTYSYDMVLSKVRNAAAGSNEIHLGYRLFHDSKILCPSRFW